MRNATFLQLAPEFGGTKFGPFDVVEIRLGSDPGASEITLPETLGVAPQHVKVLRQQDNSFIVAPVDKTAPVYFFRAGTARGKQVTSPMAVQSGDAFSLVTPEGPRFTILVETDPLAIKEASKEAWGPNLGEWGSRVAPTASRMKRGLWFEIKRRGFAAVFTTRMGNMGMRLWTMVKTGSIFSPVYIVSGMLMMSGWLFAGGAACSALRLNTGKMQAATELSSCRDQLGVAQDQSSGEPTELTVPQLAQLVLGDPEWRNTVESDRDLYDAFTRGLREAFADGARYRWVYTKKGSTFTRFRGALESAGMPPAVNRVVAYAAVSPHTDRTWTIVKDSQGEEVCGRGVLGLTYRQATNLGMTVVPDALVDAQLADSNDVEKQREALDATVREAGAEYKYRDNEVFTSEGAQTQGGPSCLHVDGADERDDLGAIASAISRKIGASAAKVPKADAQHWVAARLVWLYAQDYKPYQLEELDLKASTPPSIAMSNQGVEDDRRDFAVGGAGRLMGRAAAIACMANFDREQRTIPNWFTDAPPLGSCAILKAYVEYDRL
ncbi:MAG: hypothetical protein R3F59_00510 [Myxococcota bacterium]